MKKTIVLAAGLLGVFGAQAQTQKGNGILSGGFGLGYDVQKVENPQNESYEAPSIRPQLNVQIGQFVADNWLLGVGVGYSGRFSKRRFNTGNTVGNLDNATDVSLAPFFRRYWSVGPVVLFAGAGVEASLNHSYREYDPDLSYRNTRVSINPTVEAGGTYFLSKRLGVQGTISGTSLPIPASTVGLGLVYWMGPSGTGLTNPETELTPTQAGNWVVEGGFSTTFIGDENKARGQNQSNNTNQVTINASIGRFVTTNTLVGLRLGFSSQKMETTPVSGPFQTYSISPFVQRYVSNQRLTPFVRASVEYSNSGSTRLDNRANSVSGSVQLGLAYRLSNRFLVETALASASYQYLWYDRSIQSHAANLSASLGSGLSVRYVIVQK
ncbi:hypothetical protein [Rudanella lutea]|uniref:hypothetical protein n=1 Tax=Rudanella lutea TaxID=451374 RepID=UPI0003760999|nr:hypothetical protein [Rudanella lutea]